MLQKHPLNAPFELRPANGTPTAGVLLVHGLLDSAFIMRDIGHHLQSQGCLVRSVLLPGHGTVPGALLNVQYTDWLETVRDGIATLKQEVDKIFIVGFSTGASLALYHALKNPEIAGLVLIAPALRINSSFTFLSKWLRTKWFYQTEEIDPVKYQSIPFNAIYQVYQLGLEIEKMGVEKISHCPILMVLSHEDKVICSRTAINYFQQTTHPANRALIYSATPQTFTDPRILVKNASFPDKNILSLCHISLPVAPDNPHYGEQGDCVYASHFKKNVKYGAFDKTEIDFHNLLYRAHLTPYQYQRLTYNPLFDALADELTLFFSR